MGRATLFSVPASITGIFSPLQAGFTQRKSQSSRKASVTAYKQKSDRLKRLGEPGLSLGQADVSGDGQTFSQRASRSFMVDFSIARN